jgi:hypothetical protein
MNLDDLTSAVPDTPLPDLVARLRALATALEEVALFGPASIKTDVSISDWVIAKRVVPVLVGRMDGHPHIKDGRAGATTEIFYFDQKASVVRTFNRWYQLGTPCRQQQSFFNEAP